MSTVKSHSWRTDIVGLRAFSVLAVMLYHIWPDQFAAGYLGVDVFFVISGFVITSLLIGMHAEKGKIQYIQFFKKRILRLFPSFLVVAFLTIFFSFLLFPPAYLHEAGLELILPHYQFRTSIFYSQQTTLIMMQYRRFFFILGRFRLKNNFIFFGLFYWPSSSN